MGDFEEKLNSILSDPGQMEKITAMASKLMGGESMQEDSSPGPDMMSRISALMSGGGGEKTALLRAIEPYISEDRRLRLHRAMQLARAATIAQNLFSSGEGGE